jgi:hypothetical protein
MSRTSVLLADDHVMLLEGLVRLLQRDFNLLGIAHDGRSLIKAIQCGRHCWLATWFHLYSGTVPAVHLPTC